MLFCPGKKCLYDKVSMNLISPIKECSLIGNVPIWSVDICPMKECSNACSNRECVKIWVPIRNVY